jgi:hypothetical protein
MVPTTTPNPDDTPPKHAPHGQHEWSREYGTVSRRLYPEAARPPLLSTADELLVVVLAHTGQTFRAFEGMRPVGVERATWIEFENGDRYEVAGR